MRRLLSPERIWFHDFDTNSPPFAVPNHGQNVLVTDANLVWKSPSFASHATGNATQLHTLIVSPRNNYYTENMRGRVVMNLNGQFNGATDWVRISLRREVPGVYGGSFVLLGTVDNTSYHIGEWTLAGAAAVTASDVLPNAITLTQVHKVEVRIRVHNPRSRLINVYLYGNVGQFLGGISYDAPTVLDHNLFATLLLEFYQDAPGGKTNSVDIDLMEISQP